MALALDEATWDLETPLRKATPEEQVRQSVKIRLETQQAEWAFDVDQGLPYHGVIFTRKPDFPLIESLIRVEVGKVLGVVAVPRVELTFDATTRHLSAEVDAETDYGLVTVAV